MFLNATITILFTMCLLSATFPQSFDGWPMMCSYSHKSENTSEMTATHTVKSEAVSNNTLWSILSVKVYYTTSHEMTWWRNKVDTQCNKLLQQYPTVTTVVHGTLLQPLPQPVAPSQYTAQLSPQQDVAISSSNDRTVYSLCNKYNRKKKLTWGSERIVRVKRIVGLCCFIYKWIFCDKRIGFEIVESTCSTCLEVQQIQQYVSHRLIICVFSHR